MRSFPLTVLGSLVLLGGCASTSDVRTLADQSGHYVQSLSDGTDSFIKNADQLNIQDEMRLRAMDADAAEKTTEAREQRLAWIDGGYSDRVQTFDQVTSVSANEIVLSMSVVPPTPAAIAPVTGGYDASLKALAEASKKPSNWDQIKELYAFGKAVSSTYADLKAAAQKDATDATAKAASQTSSDTKSAALIAGAAATGAK